MGLRQLDYADAKAIPLKIVGGNNFGRYGKISSEQTFNMITTDGCSTNYAGYKKVNYLGGKQGRGIYTSDILNKMIVVSDEDVYSIDNSISSTLIGNLKTVDGDVFIAENLNGQIAICDGLSLYVYDYKNSSFTEKNLDFLPGHVSFQDGYFIASSKGKNQWRLSGANNAEFPDTPPDVGLIQSKPTTTVACVPFGRQLFVFGTNVCEVWKNIGTGIGGFPYQRSNSILIDYGCLNAATIGVGFSKIVWLASNEKSNVCIMASNGGEPQRISSDGLDDVLSNLKNPEAAFGFLFQLNGHVFYQITFTKDNLTFLYDFNENSFYSLTDEKLNHHIAKRVTFYNGKTYFISFINGDLYELNSSYYDLDGEEMPKFRILNNIRSEDGQPKTCNLISIIMEQGFNQGEQAINLSISKDGGESFGSIYRKVLNPYGKRQSACNFYSLGFANDFCFKFNYLGKGRVVVCNAMGYFSQ